MPKLILGRPASPNSETESAYVQVVQGSETEVFRIRIRYLGVLS